MHHDRRGLEVTAADPRAVASFDRAIESVLAHRGDVGAAIEATLAFDDEMALCWVLRGGAHLLLARQEGAAPARAALLNAESSISRRGGTWRERQLTAALRLWVDGDMYGAADAIDRVLAREPLDAFALKLGHGLRFMLGDAVGMQRSLAGALPAWRPDVPDVGYVLGCQAFALEELGALTDAEATGRRAVELAPDDVWGAHAVAHVFEMSGRPREGIDWLDQKASRLGQVNNFAGHIHWHRAIFHVALGAYDRALALYDGAVRADESDDFRDFANAVSLLWRLEALGVDVGRRWEELGRLAAQRGADPTLVFSIAHRAFALIATGRASSLERMIIELEEWAADNAASQAHVLRAVGLALLRAIAASAGGRHDLAVDLLFPVHDRLAILGGSHAQRDLFHWFLTDAAIASSQCSRAFQLLAARSGRHVPNDWVSDRMTRLASRAA